jgi:hypothetical protein
MLHLDLGTFRIRRSVGGMRDMQIAVGNLEDNRPDGSALLAQAREGS